MAHEITEHEFRAYERALRTGMVAYGFSPTEVLLLLILWGETFERNEIVARVDLERWAAMIRSDGRADKLLPVFRELANLQVVDWNLSLGTYQLRPDPRGWSSLRGQRVVRAAHVVPELPLEYERPLSDALSALSREEAAADKSAIGCRPCLPDKSAGDDGPIKPILLRMPGMPAEKSSTIPMHEHVGTCNSGTSKELHAMHGGSFQPKASSGLIQDNLSGEGARLYEVGELEGRSAESIMADLVRLAPGLKREHLDHWRERIERESAELVNAVVREAQMQRRKIANPAGWMNANYLKAIRARNKARV